jgi:predicted Zn finger-like uncharacterized protein
LIVQCTNCRARFNAPDEFAGRKVRCRKCSTVIAVPLARANAGGGENGKDVLYADELESLDDQDFSGGGGRSVPHAGGPRLDLVDPDELFQQASAHFDPPRSNALYPYPLSGQIDRWLPFLIVVPSFAWLCSQAFRTASDAGMPGWVGLVRLLLILLGFFVLILPATYFAVSYASKKLRFRLPAWTPWRVGAVFSLPYVLAAAMWLIQGESSDYVMGCAVGLVMALPALWLLLRLDPQEGPQTLSLAGCSFLAATGAAVGLGLLFATLVNASLDPANKPTAMRENPLGPGLRWDRPPPPKVAAAAPPKPPVPHDTWVAPPAATTLAAAAPPSRVPTTSAAPVPAPPPATAAVKPPAPPVPPATTAVAAANPSVGVPMPPGAAPTTRSTVVDPLAATQPSPNLPPLMASLREGFTGRFEGVLAPPAPRSYVAVLTRTPEGQPLLTRYDLGTWQAAGEAVFSGRVDRVEQYHLSSDGALVARLTRFPSLSVQIYSFLERKFLDPVALDEAQGEPNIVGFAGPGALLVLWRRADAASTMLEVVDVAAGKWTKRIPKIGAFEAHPSLFAISDDGRAIALLSRDQFAATAPVTLQIHSLTPTDRTAQRIAVTQLVWNAGVRIAGVALSPDRTEVSILTESEGQGLFLAWDVASGKPTRKHLQPAGVLPPGAVVVAFEGNGLHYLDGGRAWLVYGTSVYDVARGRRAGTLDLYNPIRQWVSGDTCYIYRVTEKSIGVMNAVKLDVKKLRELTKP